MKKTLLLFAAVSLPFALFAQITITAANGPTTALSQQNDRYAQLAVAGPLPSLAPQTNGSWDFTVATDSFYNFNLRGAASNPVFPAATFTSNIYFAFAAGLKYYSREFSAITPGGVLAYGLQMDKQAIPLGMLTADPGDTLVFPTQNILYSVPIVEYKFPLTMGTTSTTFVTSVTDFVLTVASAGLNNTPGQRATYRTVANEVVGWGKAKVNDSLGNPTAWIDVLQMNVTETNIDSFYLGGAPAPPAILAAFGLTQGQIDISKYQYYQRAGERKPLVEVKYSDNAGTLLEEIEVHNQRLPAAVGIATIAQADLRIFPNPVIGNAFTVQLDGKHQGAVSYEVYNMTGQKVSNGTVPSSGQVVLSQSLPTGNYLLKLTTADGQHGTRKILISN